MRISFAFSHRYTPYDVRGLYIVFLGICGIIPYYIHLCYELKYISQLHPNHYKHYNESSPAPRDALRTIS